MNSEQYIIKSIDKIIKKRGIPPCQINQSSLKSIFDEMEWTNIVDIIPDIILYYKRQYTTTFDIPNAQKNMKVYNQYCHFQQYISSGVLNSNKYNKQILTEFSKISNAFYIVNIKYDRQNFLPYSLVLDNILTRIGHRELCQINLKTNYNKVSKIWEEIEAQL